MSLNRRSFLEALVAATAAAPFAESLAEAETSHHAAPHVTSAADNHEIVNFWEKFLDAADETGHSRGQDTEVLAAPDRKIVFLHHGPKGLRWVDRIDSSELMPHDGDILVDAVTLGGFRAGTGDQGKMKEYQSAQLRLDCTQTKSLLDVLGVMGWSSLASVFTDKAGKLPSAQDLSFQSASTMGPESKILLPGGRGKISFNVYAAHRESLLHKVLTYATNAAEMASNVVPMPAISIPAMKTFAVLYQALDRRISFLLNSSLNDFVVTQSALNDPTRPARFMRLISGDYVLVPRMHMAEVEQDMANLEMDDGGFLVKKSDHGSPEARRANAVPGVTYVTLRISLSPYSAKKG